MTRSFLRALLIFMIVSGLVLVNIMHLGTVQASTHVSGVIAVDTTWTLTSSPYVVTAPLLVDSGVTLTIEPGVIVYLNDTYMRVNGTLNARGTIENPISLICNGTGLGFLYASDNAAIQFTSKSTSWNEQTGAGSIIENAVISTTQATHTIYIDDASPKINNCTVINTGGQRSIFIEVGAPIISNCSITSDFCGITCTTGITGINDAHILDNTISDCDVDIEIYGGSPVIEGNLIVDNTGNKNNAHGGIRVNWGGTTPLIRNNTIVGNSLGFNLLDSPSPTITFNNIQDNIEYSIYLNDGSESDIDATNNWWGTSDVSSINQSIRDFKNDFNLGVVSFVPFLTEPNPSAPAEPTQPEPTTTLAPQISISVDASSTAVGSAVNVNGRLADVNGSALQGKLVTLSYSIAGNDWVPIGSGTTNAAGEYTIQWINTASGTFTLKVEWAGNDGYLGASATTTLSFLPYQNQQTFFVESNSTVSALTFNSTNTELSFTVNGPSGSSGYVKATIPKDLLYTEEDWVVLVDKQPVIPTVNEDANNTYLHFTYGHSTKTIEIIGTDAIPEFPSWIILPLLLTATLLIILCKRRLAKTTNN
jgi:hypothetical protein